jgi:hypothetical protein
VSTPQDRGVGADNQEVIRRLRIIITQLNVVLENVRRLMRDIGGE